ncbi:unnamed protein product [Cuscuta epithymum]|uniref:Polygalacturonase n=1 Tax=Cuscuta epithymum TaxID=186058 RepID=A0AAV0EQG4_9ASTE|nr:unnamed protein product [Cuscuta epithymum]
MLFKGVKLTAPGNSPNTDGIKIGASKNIQISRSVIATGDDCVAMVSGSQKIGIDNVACGPGHGISIGSLGKSKDEFVSDIHIRRCSLSGTQNGLRIKTWADSFQGKVSNVIFEDVEMNNVNNPLFIDQQYCPSGHCSSESTSSVEIRNVTFKNIWGTSSSSEAVIMDCSLTNPCQDVKLVDINLDYSGNGATISQCSNVHGNADGEQRPPGCLR